MESNSEKGSAELALADIPVADLDLLDADSSYPPDWYARRDSLQRDSKGNLWGNWSRPASACCDVHWSKWIEPGNILALDTVGRCADGIEIVRVTLRV